jgi:ABC-type Fe3+ transport system substrate-binding protein
MRGMMTWWCCGRDETPHNRQITKLKTRAIVIFSLLALIIALPLALRRETSSVPKRDADDHLVILTPHNESIRNEVGEAFARYWRERTGRTIHLDWRTPGGTSEIRMVLDAGFKAAAETGREGIGVDLFFGGGEPDFNGQAAKDRFVTLEVFSKHPGWFGGDGPIPQYFTGERYWPDDHVWVGACVSQFGICFNPDVLERLGLPHPVSWRCLADPRYAGSIALADPTKSGSVARTFELIVQSEILREIDQTDPADRDGAIARGWENGLRLIQKLAANARYFTDSASKIPLDVVQGNAAAGMCIDFYGRSYSDEVRARDGGLRLFWIAPQGGTTLSADPVAVLKGAPNPRTAQAFVEFCLSLPGQRLWFAKPGTPGGPRERALHRTPIRRDAYTPEFLTSSVMPAADPYRDPGNFTYQRELTGGAFNTLRQLVKIMCIDSHHELKAAWRAIIDAGMPADALAVFSDVSVVAYEKSGQGDPTLDTRDALAAARRAAELGGIFRANYRKAGELAKTSP